MIWLSFLFSVRFWIVAWVLMLFVGLLPLPPALELAILVGFLAHAAWFICGRLRDAALRRALVRAEQAEEEEYRHQRRRRALRDEWSAQPSAAHWSSIRRVGGRAPAPFDGEGGHPVITRAEQFWNIECYTLRTMASLLEHTLLEAHDPASGRYDALRVGQRLGLSGAEMAQLLGWTPRGVRKNPTSPRLQEPLTRLMAMVTLLRDLLDGSMPYVRVWLRAPHPALGGRTPLSYLLEGRPEPVEDLVRAIATGQPD
jgi:hypothetical protein